MQHEPKYFIPREVKLVGAFVLIIYTLLFLWAHKSLGQPDVFIPIPPSTLTSITVISNTTTVINGVTNILITTNVYFTQNINVSGKATLNLLTISNSIWYNSKLWGGPSNVLSLTNAVNHYSSRTPCRVTGLIDKATTNVQPFELHLLNIESTNWTFTADAGFADLNYGANTYTVTQGTEFIWAGHYDPILARSNAVGRISP